MNVGMLWLDNDPKADLLQKVERAAVYYRNKYGKIPTLCFVNPKMFASFGEVESIQAGAIEVRPTRSILMNHLWMGMK